MGTRILRVVRLIGREGRDEGREDGARALRQALVAVFAARGLAARPADQARIAAARDLASLAKWVALAATATSVSAVVASKAKRARK